MAIKVKRTYTLKKSTPDIRDTKYRYVPLKKALPPATNNRASALEPAVLDQGQLGSCFWNALGNHIVLVERLQQGFSATLPSRMYGYQIYLELAKTFGQDTGTAPRDGMKVYAKQGMLPESAYPYNLAVFKKKPDPALAPVAARRKITSYHAVAQNLQDLKSCCVDKYGFIMGITVYDSFESAMVAKTGRIPMPKKTEKCLGGHMVRVVDYSDVLGGFICQNSWNTTWGDKGYFVIPYEYVMSANLASDFWTVRSVGDTVQASRRKRVKATGRG